MQIVLPHPAEITRQLAPFLLLSLLLHIVLLVFIRLPAKNFPIIPTRPLEVYFSAPAVIETIRVSKNNEPTKAHDNPVPISALQQTSTIPPSGSGMTPTDEPSSKYFDSQQLMKSAKTIARDESIKTEKDFAATEKKRHDSPVGLLEQYLRQPHEEIRLANGVLKITTSAGTICFQPVPYFAHDAAGLFGIPTACP
jgi:hypothetical protein